MKAILMSIQSKHLVNILNGEKTVELRKRFPIDYRGWVYLYCTKAKPYLIRFFGRYFITDYLAPEVKDYGIVKNGLVVARVWVDNVELSKTILIYGYVYLQQKSLWLTNEEIMQYANNSPSLTVIYFSKLEIFDKPKELGEFSVDHSAKWRMPIKAPIIKAPQSWQYVEVEDDNSNEILGKEVE